ncbi:sigma 54-interacting transcriptional regulator [Desemzia incerta]|uniref:sigma 54-interacting transcriptional regulator n=1 Tax=Desemzia incerta TaxID=82801 RepID=UPI0016605B71|nr:sigma-54-dependent transcriptional regulator [Desemzia incerta]
MNNRKDLVLTFLQQKPNESFSAKVLAEELKLDRSNVSRYLNELYNENKVHKNAGRPVLFQFKPSRTEKEEGESKAFSKIVGHSLSLKVMVQQAKAAILYPPRGLHTIIFGETGTGKSVFARSMYEFALESKAMSQDAPFISFNCADYAQNPQLLFGHIFGVKKGSYTGATEDSPGLLKKADGGILFLDEIHRLPPEGQEMLFTFIDKGVYQPLGESGKEYEASVQIIGATTENSDVLLSTFNRRIPMSITMPPLRERTIDERYQLVASFLQQEAHRLNQEIVAEREVVLAFMLYHPEANIGQVERDLKLVCAKAFLHYRTNNEDHLTIKQEDLPLPVQKGLLLKKEAPERLNRIVKPQQKHFSFEPNQPQPDYFLGSGEDMSVYNAIEERVDELLKSGAEQIDLETFVENGMGHYFSDYIEQLASREVRKELISKEILKATDLAYDVAEKRLNRSFNNSTRFAFSLHLQSTLDRIRENRQIIHPNLNGVRKQYSKEFQVAIELSALIEEQFAIEIPLDEIGFITMFLTIDLTEKAEKTQEKVGIVVIMHGKSTATSMLETVQELLDTKVGIALDMPLTMKVKEMYEVVRTTLRQKSKEYTKGIFLLTDMGSLNSFGGILAEELSIPIKTLSMTSTPIVLEAVRMSSLGRPLEDIYQSCLSAMNTSLQQIVSVQKNKPHAIVVTCFTGEGVAKSLEDKLENEIDTSAVKIISLQFLQREQFRQQIDHLMADYDIKAIVGTIAFDYASIPYYSAYDIFEDSKLNELKRRLEVHVSIEEMANSLSGTLRVVGSISDLLTKIQTVVNQVLTDRRLQIDSGVKVGLMLHMAFLVDALKSGTITRKFPKKEAFLKENRLLMDVVKTKLLSLEQQYSIQFPEDEIAYISYIIIENAF